MTTLHIENTVHDFDRWKDGFDNYARFRAEHGVETYRVSRGVDQPDKVIIDLEFPDDATARAFLPRLAKIMETPRAQEQLVSHEQPRLYRVVTEAVVTS